MASITISTVTVPNWGGTGDNVSLLIYANAAFTAASGTVYPATIKDRLPYGGLQSLGTFYKAFPCTVSGGNLTIPAITLDSTTDSPDNAVNATFSAVLWDTSVGQPIQTFGTIATFSLAPSPTTQTWVQVAEAQPGIASLIQSGPTIFAMGSVTTLAPGAAATATITGNPPVQTVNLGIPQGVQGVQGPVGGALATTTPTVASGTGSAGVATTSSASDHVHPSEVAGHAIAPLSVATPSVGLQAAGTTTGTVAPMPPNGINADHAWSDARGNLALYSDTSGNVVVGKQLFAPTISTTNDDVSGTLTTGSVSLETAGTNLGAVAATPTNLISADHAWSDKFGNLALYSDTSGNVIVGRQLSAPQIIAVGLALTTALTAPGLTVQLAGSTIANVLGLGTNPLNVDHAWSDNLGNLALYSDTNGNVTVGGNLKVFGTLTAGGVTVFPSAVAEDQFGNFYFTQIDGNGKVQIAQLTPAGVTTLLTSGSNNWVPQVQQSLILFMSDRGGSAAPYLMRLNGQDQLPVNVNLIQPWGIEHIVVYGQSLSTGHFSTPVLDTTQPYLNLTWNGTNTGNDNGVHADATNITAFGPLVESLQISDTAGETICSSMCNGLTLDLLALGKAVVFLAQSAGLTGTPYSGLAKGTAHYALVLASVTSALALATAEGKTYGVSCIPLIHGNSDETNTIYDQNLITWQSNFETDIKAITGQAESIPMLLSQANEFGIFPPPGNLQGRAGLLQLKVCEQNPGKFYMVTPQYFLPRFTDNLHFTAQSERILGDYFRKALKAIKKGDFWTALRPRSWSLIGTTLVMRFWVPVAPLAIDTSTVTEPTTLSPNQKYGFYIQDSAGNVGSVAITSIVVSAPDTLTFTLGSAPAAGSFLAYANNVASFQGSGPTSGGRGNLRDSDTTPSFYTPSTLLYNWCVAFQKAIN